ncbi:MAG: hypothetical protein AB7P20_14795 [Rhizobiaceae bacterium]
MRGVGLAVAAWSFTAASIAPAPAVEIDVTLLWHACPFLVDTAATAALRRLDLPLETIGPIADYACNVARSYQEAAVDPAGQAEPYEPQTADEIFCEGSTLDYCAGVRGAAPMSFAFRCLRNGLSLEQCAVDAINSQQR